METEHIVLVNEANEVIGTAPKLATHSDHTPLHRGFSVFMLNPDGKLLLQQRSLKKKTWPGTWSNSVCGHPSLNESPIDAAKRRLSFELGIENVTLHMILPDYRYRCEKDGIVENEFCPVMVGFSSENPVPNPDEVESVKWISWQDWLIDVKNHPEMYSPWAIEETELLSENEEFNDLLATNCDIGN